MSAIKKMGRRKRRKERGNEATRESRVVDKTDYPKTTRKKEREKEREGGGERRRRMKWAEIRGAVQTTLFLNHLSDSVSTRLASNRC